MRQVECLYGTEPCTEDSLCVECAKDRLHRLYEALRDISTGRLSDPVGYAKRCIERVIRNYGKGSDG
jgi:hypothetical protein